MKHAKRLLAPLTAIAACSFAHGALPKFWNTGEGLTSGMVDSHWLAEKVQGSTPFVGQGSSRVMDDSQFPVLGGYTNRDYTNSKWISFSADGYCNNDDIFKFSQRFFIDSETWQWVHSPDAGELRFTGIFSSDNASEMYVNGVRVAGLPYYEPVGGYSFEARKPFDAGQHLQEGWNEVSFLVGSANTMGANVGPITEWMGLRVEGQLQAVPEPASLAVLTLGAVAAMRRRRK